MVHEGTGDIFSRHFKAKQIAAHIVLDGEAASRSPIGNHLIVQQAGTDAIGINRIDADVVGTVFQRGLAVRGSEGARDIIVPPVAPAPDDGDVAAS